MSQYPSDFDTDVEIPRIEDNITESGAETINAIRSAIFALQRALGTDPQGSANDLTTRLSQSLNDDGTLKTAALILTGIVNSDVAVNAAIVESKLDLDVATQYLQDQVVSNDIDIAALQQSIAQIISNFARHVAGTAFRHDSFDIDLDSVSPLATPPAFTDLTSINVGDALIEMNDRFLDHADTAKVAAHLASNISVNGTNFRTIPVNVDDVQEALEELDNARAIELIKHRDHLHANGFDNWANNLDGYNQFLQLVPATYGDSVVAQIIPGTTNQIRFTGLNLSALGVDQGSVVAILNGAAAGQYIIDDVGPRAGVGIRPSLNQDEVELTLPVLNAASIVDGYVEAQVFGQSSVFTFKSNVAATFHQSAATLDSIQLSRPNAAKVITLGLKTHLIDNTQQLDIEVGVGSGLSRTISLTALDEDRSGPVSTITVDTIVDRINRLFQGSNVFPASAYRVGDELCLAHNWDESREYYIKVINSSAATVLGFDGYGADVLDKEIYPTHMSKFYINGYEHTEFAEILEDTAVASGTTITLDTVNPAAAGVKVGHLLHITNHATTAEMGTYFITSVSSSSVIVHDSIIAGAIDVRVVHDAVPLHELANTTDSLVIQTFLDSAAQAHYNIRSSYDRTITNLDIVDISDNFLAGTYSLESITTTGGHLLQLDAGVEVFVPTGFIGQKIVFGDSNVEWIAVNVVGVLGTGAAEIIINGHIDEEEVLEVCSVMTNGLETLFNVRDKRLFGSIGQDELREDVIQNYIENPLVELRSNGVVKGFDIINPNEVDPVYPTFEGVLLRGGTAYIDGVRNDVRTSTVVMPDTAGTFHICLNKLGNYVIINNSDFTLGDIIDGHAGAVLPIVDVVHSGTAITSAIDRRYFINNLDAKVDIIADLTNHMIGSFASFEAAVAFANAYTADEKFFIRVVSHTANPLTIPLASRDLTIEIDGYVGTVYAYSSCKIRSRGLVERTQAHIAQGVFVYDDTTSIEFENLNVSGTVFIDSVTDLDIRATNCKFADSISFSNSGTERVHFFDCVFNNEIISDSVQGGITFSNCLFDGSVLSVEFVDGTFFSNCIFKNNIDTIITTDGIVRMSGCSFSNTENPFILAASNADVSVSNCTFSDCTFVGAAGIAFENSGNLLLSGCTFKNITVPNQWRLIDGDTNTTVCDCLFSEITWASTAAEIIQAGSFINNLAVDSVGEVNVKAEDIFSYNRGFHQITVGSSSQTQVISGNNFPETTTFGSSVLFEAASILQAIVSDNTFDIASNGIGIQYNASNENIKITGNHFVGTGSSSVAINLSSGAPSVISGNTFQTCTAFENSAALNDSIISNNFADGYQISITIGDNFQFSNNQFDGYVDLSGTSVECVLINGNILPGGLNIGAELNRSSVINNYVGPDLLSNTRYANNIIQISASIYDSIISGNHGVFSAETAITFDGVIFNDNVGGLQVSTSPNLEWKDCIVSKNKFLQTFLDEPDEFTLNIYSDISNTPANVIFSENDFSSLNIHIVADNTISHFFFVGNRNIMPPSAVFILPEASINYCSFSENLNLDFACNEISVDNTLISNNLSATGTYQVSGVINNTSISNNICNVISVLGSSSAGLTVSNNIAYTILRFAFNGDNNFVGSSIIGNQCPQFDVGNSGVSAVTNSIVSCKFDGNICNTLGICKNSRANTVSVFSENIISNNKVLTEINFLSEASSSNYNNILNDFSSIVFFGNITGQFNFYGGLVPTDNLVLDNFSLTSNIISDGVSLGSYLVFTNLIISQNSINSSSVAGIRFNQVSAATPATAYVHNNILISSNIIQHSDGTAISMNVGAGGLPGTSRLNNLSIVNNHMLNMNVSFALSSSSLTGDFNINGVNISNNYLRAIYFANNSSVAGTDISVYGAAFNCNAFSGDAADEGIHVGKFFGPGFHLENNSSSTGQALLFWSTINGNRNSSIATDFSIRLVRDGLGGTGDIGLTGCTIDSNVSVNIVFSHPGGVSAASGFYTCGFFNNRNGSFDNGDFSSTHGVVQDCQFVGNHLDFVFGDVLAFTRTQMFCNTGTFTVDTGRAFDTGTSTTRVFPWGNVGTGAGTLFNGGIGRTVASTNDDTAIAC